ncbi:GNAT family N-acetyltransferase [Pseudoflavonifractor sp. MSJ-37]|uniref:GNAT family N-acetyltransferase n=1 Tax=Pseudoflavonifractor sp. MSJ-37 TaxID=2841531 RepID=UPI003530534B
MDLPVIVWKHGTHCDIIEEELELYHHPIIIDTGRIRIRREEPADYRAAEALTRDAFWDRYRPGCLEHYVLHCFRDRPEFVPELDLVLEQDGILLGHVMYARAEIRADDGRRVPIMTFGPISIRPDCQRQGLGKRLLDASMDLARTMGAGALCMEGDIGFYSHCGFREAWRSGIDYYAMPRGVQAPFLLLRELEPGWLDGASGVYQPPEGYFVDEAEAEAFDAAFPPREEHALPGQLG